MVRTRKAIYVGNQEVKRRYIGNKLIFENLVDMDDKVKVSGVEIFTDKADDAVVHVEIDGKSYQDGVPSPDYPIEIHSLNDFDVVSSVGRKNLTENSYFRDGLSEWRTNGSEYVLLEDGYVRVNSGRSSAGLYQSISDIEVGDTVTISALIRGSGGIRLGIHRSDSTEIEIPSDWERVSATITRTGTATNVTLYTLDTDSYFDITDIQVEFGTQATPYSPNYEEITESDNHPLIDKINILLDEPLRSVGNVKDRLFRDSDGLWKIERNVGEATFDEAENWGIWYTGDTSGMFGLGSNSIEEPMLKPNGLIISNMFPSMNVNNIDEEGMHIGSEPRLRVRAFYERVGTTPESTDDEKINSFKQWLSNTYTEGVPLTIVYELETPTIETLGQELQAKLNNLRSFQDSKYVYAIINDKTDNLSENLKPTLHTTFKSKGWYDYYKKHY